MATCGSWSCTVGGRAGAEGNLAIISPSPPESLSPPFPLPFPQFPIGGAEGTPGSVNPNSDPESRISDGAFALIVFRRDLKSELGAEESPAAGVGVPDSDSGDPRSLSLPDRESMSLPETLSGSRASLLRLALSQSSSGDEPLLAFPSMDVGFAPLTGAVCIGMEAAFTDDDDLTCDPGLLSTLNLEVLLCLSPAPVLLARRLNL